MASGDEQDVVAVHLAAFSVDRQAAVGVTVEGQADVAARLPHDLGQLVQVKRAAA